MISCICEPELDALLADRPRWTYDVERRALSRQLIFADFSEALAAIVRIGTAAEKSDHHPEWFNVYNRLDIWLTTHEAGGVTSRDVALAALIDHWFPADELGRLA